MRLKELELHGYKSFANRTSFSFPPGITAVIGPNGSGKSNIADGIRWVLGEQSFNLLRGKKTEDMIFSGSDQRARLGMAQVTLTLDNSDGTLPLDFAEVTITRRAYRSGENEYLLNGNRVRLKDIAELLGRSGLSRRTYTVIGQGLVDQVLAQRPEERRNLFEEAAGITVYQAKRDEALRRLDETQSNLQRVHDVIQELAPRLRHLKQAAERANQANQLQTDLRALLEGWYGYQWHTTLRALAQAQSILQRAQAQQASELRQLDQLDSALEQARTRQAALRRQLGEWHRASSGYHREAETVQRELAVAEERARLLTAHRHEALLERDRLGEMESAAAQRAALAVQQLDAARQALAVQAAQVAAAESALATRRATRLAHQQAFEQAQHRLASLSASAQESRLHLTQLAERMTTLTADRATHLDAITRASDSVQASRQQLEAQQAAADRATAEIDRLSAARAQQVALAAEADTERRRLSDQLRDVQRTLDRLQARYDLLTRLRQEGAGYATGPRAVLQEAQHPTGRSRLQVLGTVASLLHVPSELEAAMEAALGGQLQDIVVETWDDAETAIDFLKRSGAGRATFLPLDTIRANAPLRIPSLPGVVGVAAALVSAETRLQPLVQYLLNRVVVTADLPAARRLRQALAGQPQPTLVSLDGDLVRPGGSISGGSRAAARQEGSVLAREREWRELPAQISQAQAQGQTLESQLHVVGQRRLDSEAEQRRLHEAESTQASHRRGLQQRVSDLQRELDRHQQAVTWHGGLLAQVEAELVEQGQRRQHLETDLATQEAAIAQQGGVVDAAQAAYAALALDDADDSLGLARAAWSATQAEVVAREAAVAQAAFDQRQAAEQVHDKTARITALEHAANEVAGQISTLQEQHTTLVGHIKVFQEQIDPAESELAASEAAQAEQESRAARQRTQLRVAEARLSQANLELARNQDSLTRLRQDITHDFGLVALEQGEQLPDQPPLPLGTLVHTLPVVEVLPDGLEADIQRLRQQLRRLGNVNPEAPAEYAEAAARHTFLNEQVADLNHGVTSLREVVGELEKIMDREFRKTFRAVSERFKENFSVLFGGGSARLTLVDPENPSTSGIDITARPPGKRPQNMALLSGGERALTAVALIFSILGVNPPPFCVLDEVDAALDEANVGRFREALLELAGDTQFILVTHNRGTVEAASTIYGVSMGTDNASQVISLRVDEVESATAGDMPPAEMLQGKNRKDRP